MERPLISMISRMIRAKASVPHAITRAEVAAPPIEMEALTKSVSFIHAKFGGGGETSESLWGKVCELRQGSLFEYNVYEVQFVELWERWVASLRLGEAAPDFLKKDRFVAGLCPPLREKVKGRFPVTWMDARDIARLKERKIRYQLQQREADQEEEGMAPVPPTNAPAAHRGQGNQDQQELLSRITHQLEDLSVQLVQGGRAPPPNQEQARGPRRQAQEYHCYNCGENDHDPLLGDVWKEKVFSLRFEGKDCIITLGKLKSFALTKLRVEKRVNLLSLLDAKCAAIVTLGNLSSLCDLTSPMLLPHDYPLQDYMEEIKLEARNHMFVSMRTRDSKSEYKGTSKAEYSQSKATELDQAAWRVVYRYFFTLVKEGKLKELPVQCLPWCDLESVSCMYPPNMRDLSSWELVNDPWWIDLKPGVILARERELFNLHGHGKQVISLGKEKKDKNTKTIETHDVELDIETEVANTVKNAHETREPEKELCVFAYSMVSPGDLAYCGDAPFYGCEVGSYIAMGQDFVSGKKNEVYTRIHEFFLAVKIGKDYHRMGRKVKWVADFIFLDFPTGFGLESIQRVPEWNRLTKVHVRYGVTVATASLADHGWLVMMAPLTGSCITWIERYVRIQGLEIGHCVFVLDKIAYGLVNEKEKIYLLVLESSID
ncbi:hypothetical protein L7F22_022890 [Adiantum nelumboides]|nr:hypothetical protein [Adiantum nelumboides]